VGNGRKKKRREKGEREGMRGDFLHGSVGDRRPY